MHSEQEFFADNRLRTELRTHNDWDRAQAEQKMQAAMAPKAIPNLTTRRSCSLPWLAWQWLMRKIGGR